MIDHPRLSLKNKGGLSFASARIRDRDRPAGDARSARREELGVTSKAPGCRPSPAATAQPSQPLGAQRRRSREILDWSSGRNDAATLVKCARNASTRLGRVHVAGPPCALRQTQKLKARMRSVLLEGSLG